MTSHIALRSPWCRHPALAVLTWLALMLGVGLTAAQEPAEGDPFETEGEDPFAESQLEELVPASATGAAVPVLSVSAFVDAGYISISQSGPQADGGELSWAYGNSQFTFFSETESFTLNEVDLTVIMERERKGRLVGSRASIDFYPSRDTEAYRTAQTDREFDVDQAFVFVEFMRLAHTRITLGRYPGFVTLEQEEADAPNLRLIGHTYVFTAGGGYPYGLALRTEPTGGLTLHVGVSNGGLGAYSFFPGDQSVSNRPVGADDDERTSSDKVDGRTISAGVDWRVFDRPAGAGTLRLGLGYGQNPELTYNATEEKGEPYEFTNAFAAYRFSDWELRVERATLDAFFSDSSVGSFQAEMAYLLLSYFHGTDHLLTARLEHMTFETDREPGETGEALKYGVTYRYRLATDAHVKLEAVTETQSPQFFNPTLDEDLETHVLALSWVQSY